MKWTYNFNAGPSAIPKEVLERAKSELTNFKNTGVSVMELSHRSQEYETIHNKAIQDLKDLLQIPDSYHVLFLQGGASLQFSMIPLNFLPPSETAHYVQTGIWSEKALFEAKKIGRTSILASSKHTNYTCIPNLDDIVPTDDSAYVHITSNNTIYGTQWHHYPNLNGVPLIADMSSDILSKRFDVNPFSFIYAGAQKNLGPSGVTVAIIKDELLTKSSKNIPSILDYKTHVKNNSLYNTPPTFSIYILSLVLEWVKELGGVSTIETINKQKASLIYNFIDNSEEFYTTNVQKDSRSNMNIVFHLPSKELTTQFLESANEQGFIGLGGHRAIGGCRASIYNAVSLEACEALVHFMKTFKERYS